MLALLAAPLCVPSAGQQLLPAATQQSSDQITALTERVAAQLFTSNKKKPFILDLTLPGDVACPLGEWLADKISESLAKSHPELEVVSRALWRATPMQSESIHDQNQQNAAKARHAQSLGAEVIVTGNFAAIDKGIGITLMASNAAGNNKPLFEALAEVPFTAEMQSVQTSPLPQRTLLDGAYKASIAGIGSPICEDCPPPQYSYVAQAKKMYGVVVLETCVTASGVAENVRVIRAPNPTLGKTAIQAVSKWHFRPATNSQGEFVPAVVTVAVSFRFDELPQWNARR